MPLHRAFSSLPEGVIVTKTLVTKTPVTKTLARAAAVTALVIFVAGLY
jgi:hypothetical protein